MSETTITKNAARLALADLLGVAPSDIVQARHDDPEVFLSRCFVYRVTQLPREEQRAVFAGERHGFHIYLLT
jgi:hypothetical protein